MPTLFVSHASADDKWANALAQWLDANGFTDRFLDHEAILAGEKWAEKLRESAGACRVVICLVSEHWLSSDECFAEFRAAWYMGKRIVPLFLLGPDHDRSNQRLAIVRADDQGIDLSGCLIDGKLDIGRDARVEQRLREGLGAAGALTKVGLDPRAFSVDRKARPDPFPGLSAFGDEDADAARFFGRSREIAEALEQLRQMRASGDGKVFVMLGGSGAGKSSLLKAGVIPRLRREAPAWLALRAFRPGADPLFNLSEAIGRTTADFGGDEAPGVIRDRLRAAWRAAARDDKGELTQEGGAALAQALEAERQALCRAAGYPNPTLLVGVDQAEELSRAEGESADALADLLRQMSAMTGKWALAFTIRTDNFAELQASPRFRNLTARAYDLRALPVFRFVDVIEQPAARYGAAIEHELIDELMKDAPQADALPLLAFALQRLWHEFGSSKLLTRAHYQSLGRLTRMIDDAAERALRGILPGDDRPIAAGDVARRLDLLGSSVFVPKLVQLNEQGRAMRRIADLNAFDAEASALLEPFAKWRLIVRRTGKAGGGTIEVAHEALFRDWIRLRRWLDVEHSRLDVLHSIESASANWDGHARDRAWLVHRGKRLRSARTLARDPRYADRIQARERAYLEAASLRSAVRNSGAVAAGLSICLALALLYGGVADDGLPVPGGQAVRSWLDRHDATVFRPTHSVGEILTAANSALTGIDNRLVQESKAEHWDSTKPTFVSAQADCAMLRSFAGAAQVPDEVSRILDSPFDDGWLVDKSNYVRAETVLWTIAALAAASADGNAIDPERQARFRARLDYAQTVADGYRPVDDGGWNVLPQQVDPSLHSTFSTAVAFVALLELQSAGLGWHGDRVLLDGMLGRTAGWLAHEFDDSVDPPGWRTHLNDVSRTNNGEVADGLTLQIYSSFLRAERQGSMVIPANILAAIPKHIDRLVGRPGNYASSLSLFDRDYVNANGDRATRTFTENYLWYPWAIEASARWLDREEHADSAEEQVVRARRALGYLVVDLGSFNSRTASASADQPPPTFTDSEAAYGLATTVMLNEPAKRGAARTPRGQ